MEKYQILIDGMPYESSNSLSEAMNLYNTVDATCLPYLNGHEKSLTIDGITHKKDKINRDLSPHPTKITDIQ